MSTLLRRLLFGREEPERRTFFGKSLAPVVFVTTFVAYTVGIFAVSGGVIFIPRDAALLGILAVALIGFQRSGLVTAWLAAFACLLGFHANFAFVGLAYRRFQVQLAFFFDPDALFIYAAEGLVLAVPTYLLIVSVRWGIDLIRDGVTAADMGR